jgi:uncharacterized protein YkwD
MSLVDNQEQFADEALKAHNSYREKHGAEPLVLNNDLNSIAQAHACQLAMSGLLNHSTNVYNGQRLGENLAYSYDSRPRYYSGNEPTNAWYSEVNSHDFNEDWQSSSGHFTQVCERLNQTFFSTEISI